MEKLKQEKIIGKKFNTDDWEGTYSYFPAWVPYCGNRNFTFDWDDMILQGESCHKSSF